MPTKCYDRINVYENYILIYNEVQKIEFGKLGNNYKMEEYKAISDCFDYYSYLMNDIKKYINFLEERKDINGNCFIRNKNII